MNNKKQIYKQICVLNPFVVLRYTYTHRCQHGINVSCSGFYTTKNTFKRCLHSKNLYIHEYVFERTYTFFFINNIPDCVISNQAFLLLDQAFLLHFGVTARITRSNPVGGIDVCFA
jgi:hypothetical protein